MKPLYEFIFSEQQKIMLVLAMLVFIAGLISVIPTGDSLRYPDENDYIRLSRTLVVRGSYLGTDGRPTAYRPPGYPFVLSLVFRLWNSPLAAKIINAATLAGTAFLLALIAARVIPEGLVFAPLLVLIYPVYFYAAGTLYPQILGAFLFSTVLFFMIYFPGNWMVYATCGVLFGFLVLMIPAFLLISPILYAYILTEKKVNKQQIWITVLFFALGFILVTGPWTIRNAIVFKKLIPVSTNSGENLLLGNSENTGPNSGVNVDISHYLKKTSAMNEAERDIFLRNQAFEWAASNPRQAGILYLQKLANYYNFHNRLYVQSEASILRDRIMFITYYPLLLLAVARLATFRRFPISRVEVFLYALYLGSAVLGALFFTRIRLRLPYDTLLITIGAIFLGRLTSTFRHKNITKQPQYDII